MTVLRRRKSPKMGVREDRNLRHEPHKRWVRGCHCAVPGCEAREIEAAHYDGPIPNEDRGGMSEKDHDKWCLPLCKWLHHPEYHRLGWRRFDLKHGINTKAIAEECARTSPHRRRWQERG